MKLVIVESPSKAKTLKNYLASDYEVIATKGHFRDLPSKGMGIDETNDNFSVKEWSLDHEKADPVLKQVKKCDTIFLATDPDREGELIAWHLYELCKEKKLLKDKDFHRIEFNQVNKETLIEALNNPRQINNSLVNAALARRFLDRFFGYKISPITIRRTKFGKNAGRVQSPALKILSDREKEIDLFEPQEYWEIFFLLQNSDHTEIEFQLSMFNEKKIRKMDISNEKQALALVKKIRDEKFFVSKIESKSKKRNPYAPFSTSTLQQDASSKLNFSPTLTDTVAQQLFEGTSSTGGLITYIRTDSISLPNSVIYNCRELISGKFGKEYLPENPFFYKTKSKNAQEAHEPIRPTNLKTLPIDVKSRLNDNQYKLYKLIWERTISSQMKPQLSEETTINVSAGKAVLKTSGSIITFDGFRKVYGDYNANKDDQKILPGFKNNQILKKLKDIPKQNFTKHPYRYSEAGLIKKLEELGIGRPSTYASIISKLKKENYVDVKNKSLVPNSKGRILSKFLEKFFEHFVEFEFTAQLEEQLDKVTTNNADWKSILKSFVEELNNTVSGVIEISMSEVINAINEVSEEYKTNSKCPKCNNGKIIIKFSRNGPFFGCTKHSKDTSGCNYTSPLDVDGEDNQLVSDKVVGQHPKYESEIKIKIGRYGPYLEVDMDSEKPKRVAIPKNKPINKIDLEYAIAMLELPRTIGIYPDSGKTIIASIGPYGPYLKHDNKFISLKEDSVLEVNNNRAIDLIKEWEKNNKTYEIGIEPKSNKMIVLKKGRYGRFLEVQVNEKKSNRFTLPKDINPEELTIEKAIEIIDGKKEKKIKAKKS